MIMAGDPLKRYAGEENAMPARNLRKAARSARWPAAPPDGCWDANTKAVRPWIVTAVHRWRPSCSVV